MPSKSWNYFIAPTTPEKARGYLGLMAIAYLATFLSAAAGQMQWTWPCLWATAAVDFWLFISGQVRTKLALSIPQAVAGIAGLSLHVWLSA
jgi:hypothetical protein